MPLQPTTNRLTTHNIFAQKRNIEYILLVSKSYLSLGIGNNVLSLSLKSLWRGGPISCPPNDAFIDRP